MQGLITWLLALSYLYLGSIGWPSEVTRGLTAPGAYEYRQMALTGEGPQGYDSWTEQLKRKHGRGR